MSDWKVKKGISGSTLKIIALFSMLADHFAMLILGKVLVSHEIYSTANHSLSYIMELLEKGSVGYYYAAYLFLRSIIGRIAFPIFCFELTEGFQRTGNRLLYAERLLLAAILSEIPYNLVKKSSYTDPLHQNVIFTLLIGFGMMWAMEAAKRINHMRLSLLVQVAAFVIAAYGAQWLHCDYGAKGMAAIALLYFFYGNPGMQLFAGCVSFIWEPTALLAFVPIALYNRERGRAPRYLFYIFYPAHLLILYYFSLL